MTSNRTNLWISGMMALGAFAIVAYATFQDTPDTAKPTTYRPIDVALERLPEAAPPVSIPAAPN